MHKEVGHIEGQGGGRLSRRHITFAQSKELFLSFHVQNCVYSCHPNFYLNFYNYYYGSKELCVYFHVYICVYSCNPNFYLNFYHYYSDWIL